LLRKIVERPEKAIMEMGKPETRMADILHAPFWQGREVKRPRYAVNGPKHYRYTHLKYKR